MMAPTNASVARNMNCLVSSTGWVEVWVWEIFLGIISLSYMFYWDVFGDGSGTPPYSNTLAAKAIPSYRSSEGGTGWSLYSVAYKPNLYLNDWWYFWLYKCFMNHAVEMSLIIILYIHAAYLYRNHIFNYDLITSSFVSLQYLFCSHPRLARQGVQPKMV